MNEANCKRIVGAAAIGVLAVVCVALGLMWAGAQSSSETWEQGATSGYYLPGTYSSNFEANGAVLNADGDILSFAASDDADEIAWSHRVHSKVAAQGRVEKTDDPNIFYLQDKEGHTQGEIHLAWANQAKGKGQLYVSWNSGAFVKMDKYDNAAMG